MKSQRIEHVYAILETAGLDALALNASPNMTYLTGLSFHLSERPAVLILKPGAVPVMILPDFEKGRLESLSSPVEKFTYDENPDNWQKSFTDAMNHLGLNKKKIGVVPTHMRVLELDFLQNAAPEALIKSAGPFIASLRMQKEEEEISYMKKAVKIAQGAFLETLKVVKIGMTEKELAAELVSQLLSHGTDAHLPFMPIVASGPNGANPHAEPSDRKLSAGDLVVVDWGASHNGYFSDITRTLAIGKIDAESEKIARITIEANHAGKLAAKAGAAAGSVDAAARQVITKAGYGEYFTTRTGHGLGIEVHEYPNMIPNSEFILQPGNVFTVEPGIYLSGKAGVRIEDDVVAREDGFESLTDLERELFIID